MKQRARHAASRSLIKSGWEDEVAEMDELVGIGVLVEEPGRYPGTPAVWSRSAQATTA